MSMYRIVRTDNQIEDVLSAVAKQQNKGGSKFRGMTYEDGIRTMFDWLTDADTDSPME